MTIASRVIQPLSIGVWNILRRVGEGLILFGDTIGRGVKNLLNKLSTLMSRPPNPYIRHALELEHELISLYKETLNYERARSESAQAKLDKVLRLTDTPNLGTSIRDAKIRGIQSPMKQKYTLESESRKKYWENKVKDAPDLPEAVTSKNLD